MNGHVAKRGQFPWLATVDGYGRCGGTLIHKHWVVTAAHCFVSKGQENHMDNHDGSYDPWKNPESTWEYINDFTQTWAASPVGGYPITLGAMTLNEYQAQGGRFDCVEVHYADKVWVHPQYDPVNIKYDVALVYLPKGSSYPPIELAESPSEIGRQLTVAGFGHLETGGDAPDFLMYTNVPMIDTAECNEKYSVAGAGPTAVDPEIEFCATGVNSENGLPTDACQGDSGGPIVQFEGAQAHLVGAVSWGYDCADPEAPGVYARVDKQSSNYQWIDFVINGNEACEMCFEDVLCLFTVGQPVKCVHTCEEPAMSDCCNEGSCSDLGIVECVSDFDAFCKETAWDNQCVKEARFCKGYDHLNCDDDINDDTKAVTEALAEECWNQDYYDTNICQGDELERCWNASGDDYFSCAEFAPCGVQCSTTSDDGNI